MLRRLLTTLFFVGAVVGLTSGANAQYMKIVTDNPTDNTRLRATGTTQLTVQLNTNHDRDNSLQTCNSHSAANCGGTASPNPLTLFSYQVYLRAIGGTVTWGSFTPDTSSFTPLQPTVSDATDVEFTYARPPGTSSPAGFSSIGKINVTIVTGSPSISIVKFPENTTGTIDPSSFGTSFGTNCDGFVIGNTYILGDAADPCGNVSGLPADWYDADGAGAPASANAQPQITAPPTASGAEGTAIPVITANATDADAANTLTITQTGKPASLVFTHTPGISPRTATISGTPGFNDAGTYSIVWTVNDGSGAGNATNSATTTLTISNTNRAPVLTQPANMTVAEGATANQAITATDADGQALSFAKVSGPTYATVTTTTPGTGTGTGNINLAPGFSDAGTATLTASASDGSLSDSKTITVTVTNTNRAPVLAQPANMTVAEGATANQVITATDADGQSITFAKVSGATFATVTTTTPGTGTGTGNINLAPGFSDAGTSTLVVSASDGTASDSKTITVTVTNTDRAVVLTPLTNMTVQAGTTANQAFSASDADGDAITFASTGPAFLSRTDNAQVTTTRTGNINLAPPLGTSPGTFAASVTASANGTTSPSNYTITVTAGANQAPVLAQPANMTVNEGATANQTITATDADGQALTFSKVSGPTYLTVTTTTPGTGTGTGNINLAPGFSDAGTATAVVRASDGSANSDRTITVTVNNVNRNPVLAQPANMTVNEGATANQVITATDADGQAITFAKVSGAAFATVTTTTPGTGTGTGNINLAPGFSDAGTSTLVVSASDGTASDSKTITVTVNNVNRAPVLAQPANMTVNEGATANQAITATDADGQALTFAKVSGATFATVTTTTPGTGTGTGNINLAPGFSDAGTSTLVVSASDGTASDSKTITVTVNNVNRNPVLAQPANMTVAEGATANQVITATDADGQALTFAKVSGATFATVTTTTPGTGTGTGNINLAPGFSDAGTSTLVVSASDGTASDSKTITVTVNNTDRAVVLTPLTNMTVQAGTTANQAFSATDPDGDAITFASTGPAFLTRTDNAQVGNTRTGNINLAPPLGTSPGTFAASVTASANGTTSPSNYTITVTAGANQAPVLAQPANMTVNEGATANQTITATDADGQALTFSKVSGPAYLTVTTTTPGTGTGTGNINLAPGFSDAGTATAVVRASDGSANSDRTITVTVNNVNQAPVLAQPANMTVNEGATANQAITATDADGQALTFAKVSGATFATVTTTTPGTGTGTGNINLAPGFSDAGTSTLVVSASDGTASDSKTITVTVNNVNRAPVLAQPANMTVAEGATANQAITATDADGQALTFAKVSGATFATVTTTTPGTGTGTGNINLAPGFSDAGTSTLVVSASDGTASDSKTITVTVNNTDRAVVLTPLGAMTVQAGTTANQAFSATDPDGDAITFASTGPAFLTRTDNAQVGNTRTGNINLAPPLGTSPGTFAASVTASANGTTSPSNYTITVTAGANQAPVLAQPANMTVNEGATANQTITATDADGNALTFSKVSGPTYLTVTTTTPGTGTGTGNINLAPGFSDAGTATAVVRASDGSANSDRTITVTVNNVNRAPVLAQPANMTVDEGVTANQVITATDADGQAITFAKVSGAAFATVTTTTPGTGTGTGNINLAPGFSDAGTSTLVVSASDGTASDSKTITVTVNNVNRAPVLAQPANMTVNEGATANQAITATDADGQALTFAKVSGAAFATVTTTTPGTGTGTGNINLAPGFSDAGTSTLVVSASDGTASDSKTITVTVNNVNRAPVLAQPANMTVAEGATANQVITATDADGQALTFAKVSGATFATVTTTTPGTGTGTGNINLAPGFSDAGTSTLVVSASDGTASDSKTITVTVTNTDRAVVLTPLTNMSVQAGTTANQAFSATDPDGDAITFASTGPAFLTRTDNAQVGNTRTGNINLAPPLGTSPGTFAASVTASANGTTSPSNFTITVTAGANQAPVLAQPANMTVNEGATANQTITATDADGNALTFSKVSGPAYLTVTTTTPGTGTGTGNINLAPGFTDAGTATAVVRASDGSANSDRTITVTVNNVNRAPVLAQPANQSVAQGGTSDQVITATDADGQALTFAKVTGPTFMTVTTTSPGTGTGTGNIHLAAAAGEVTGTYSASVSASDGTASDTKSLTITVTPTNRAPVLAQPANMTVNEGATANQTLNATDPDGNSLTFSKASGPAYATVTTTTPGSGTATGNLNLAPGFSDAGTATVSVSVSDGSLSDSKTLTVTVNNVNQAPVLAQPANMTVAEGATANQSITATDADGQALSFAKVSGAAFATVTTTTPGTGTGTGNINLAPGFSDAGTSTLVVSASDGTASDSKTITVTVTNTNRAPVLAQPANMTVAEGATANQTITATDADGQALTFAKVSGAAFATVTTTTPGTGTGTGNINLAPGFSDAGTSTLVVSASDGTASDSKTITVTVTNVNRAPTLNQPTNMTVAQGFTSDQIIIGSDPDGDALTFAKVTGPAFMTVTTTNATTGNIHLAAGASEPLGTSSASVSASDGVASDTKSFQITVTPTNHAPVLAQPANMTVNEGATANQTLNATDSDGNALTFTKASGPAYATVTTTSPGTGVATGNLNLAPGFSDAGTASITVSVSDGSMSDSKSLTVTVNNVNRAPVLTQPANMTVAEGATANQVLTASDADGDALTFAKVSGPAFATVTTTTATTGNINLAPGFTDAGTYTATVSASDGSASDSKSLTITVTNTDRAVVLNAIANMSVAVGATADQAFSATDADGDAISFTSTGPAFLTRTDNAQVGNTRTGNIHLAPPLGTATGTYAASVTASANGTTSPRNFTVTVTAGANQAPTLAQPANMTVNEGQTADQTLTGSDPDGDALTFSKVSGPLFLTVTTTTATTGNAHLAPGFSDAGSYPATVRASDASTGDNKSFTITVNNVNRAPTADAGGPYSGTVGIPVHFDGTGSSDPDGDVLTYAWDFGDGLNGTGSTVDHNYAATGTYTATLTVTDNGTPALNDSDTADVTISDELAALVFKSTNGDWKLGKSNKPRYCLQIEPIDASYANSDVILSSIVIKYNGHTGSAEIGKTSIDADHNFNGINEIQACFTIATLRSVFAGLPGGATTVTAVVEGNLVTGGKFAGSVEITIRGPVTGSGFAAASVSPNPLNPSATLSFETSKPGSVRVEMFDPQGRLVRTILNEYVGAGVHETKIDGRGQSGEKLASGIYFIRGVTADGTFKNTITILK